MSQRYKPTTALELRSLVTPEGTLELSLATVTVPDRNFGMAWEVAAKLTGEEHLPRAYAA